MNLDELVQDLRGLASLDLRAEYMRNGADGRVLGVKYTYLQYFKKELGQNHSLALQLWKTQIPEIQILATMLVDQEQLSVELIEEWNKDINFYLLSDAFIGNILSRFKGSLQLANTWVNSTEEYTLRHAFTIVFILAKENAFLKDKAFLAYLEKIEEIIINAPNRAKETMLYSILNIGRRNKLLNGEAINLMERLGNQISIDHGTTGGTTPNVLEILKLVRQKEGYKFFVPGDLL